MGISTTKYKWVHRWLKTDRLASRKGIQNLSPWSFLVFTKLLGVFPQGDG